MFGNLAVRNHLEADTISRKPQTKKPPTGLLPIDGFIGNKSLFEV